jgi:ATP-binding cassette, subfamily B, multidrug efflux pump
VNLRLLLNRNLEPYPIRLNPFSQFTPYFLPYRRHLILGLCSLLVAQMIATSIPLVMMEGIEALEVHLQADGAANPVDALEVEAFRDRLTDFALFIGLLALLQWGASVAMRWYLMGMGRCMERDMRSRYMRHLLKLPPAFFQRNRTGDLIARVTSDIEFVARFPAETFRVSLTVLTTFCLSLGFMCTIDWRLALVSLAPIPLTVLVLRYVSSRVKRGYGDIQACFSSMMASIQENLSGIRVVKSYTLEEDESLRFSELNDQYVHGNRNMAHIHSLLFPFTGLLTGLSMIVVLWLGGVKVIEGTMTLGAFVAFNALLIRLGVPLLQLGRMVNEFQHASVCLSRVDKVLSEPVPDSEDVTDKPVRISGEIEFKNVHFAYGPNGVLGGISFQVPAGTTLAIVGRIGTGKTTIGRLIPRLIASNSGQILIDGISLEALPFHQIRDSIGYVPQETFLFTDTMYNNIALGLENAAPNQIVEAAAVSQLTDDLASMEQGLDTVIGERGVTLSGGQKQRTALARAVILRPQILILDDALAAVDARTEQEILDGLRDVMADRTTILIAHRISTVRDANQIIVLDDGKVAERGNHESLLQQDGIYADMYRRQHLEAEIEGM